MVAIFPLQSKFGCYLSRFLICPESLELFIKVGTIKFNNEFQISVTDWGRKASNKQSQFLYQ